MTITLQADAVRSILEALPGLAGLALLAGIGAAVVGILHRWYAGTRVPEGLAVLVGASLVALSLGTLTLFQSATLGGVPVTPGPILRNVVGFVVAAVASSIGGRAGDRISLAAFDDTPDVSRLVQSVGRGVTVTLPDDIEDMSEYDPVPADVKAELAGRDLTVGRGLSGEALHERLVTRLKSDFAVGHVDLELTDDGRVEYLAVGSRLAGIGPTLSPGSAAVAVRADPAHSASTGDLVQLWADGERVTSGEIRGIARDVVTVALDADEATRLEADRDYRLVTLPARAVDDRQFATLLRAADEVIGVTTVQEGSTLAGVTVGSLAAPVVAIRSGGTVDTIPERARELAVGDEVFVVARPETVRKVVAAATSDATHPPVDTGTAND